MCSYVGNETDVNLHIVREHSHDPSFCITCKLCGGRWKKFDSYRKHITRKHSGNKFIALDNRILHNDEPSLSVCRTTDNATDVDSSV